MRFSFIKTLWNNRARVQRIGSMGMVVGIMVFVLLFVPHVAHADSSGSCINPLNWGGCIADLVGSMAQATFGAILIAIGFVILQLANLILWVIGALFNYVVLFTIFQFGSYFGNSAGLLAAWGVLRDVANIMLIFGFVMLGMATILDIHGYEVRKTLPRLIIFAILMNFSLLASEAIIDTSNAVASVFFSQAGQQCAQGQTDQQCAESGTNGGISGVIFQRAGLATIFSASSPDTTGKNDATLLQKGTAYMGMAIFVAILSVVLLAGAIMLVSRAIVLAVLMVLSPLGFAGLAIPPLEKYALDWWHRLLAQAFFAPIYLLFIFVALKVVEGMSSGNISIMDAIANGSTSALGSVALFAVLIGFLVVALMTGKQMGVAGAGFATNMAGKAVGTAVFGTAGFIGRRTVGRGLHKISHNIKSGTGRLGRLQGTEIGRMLAAGADKGAAKSFDARGTKALGALGGATGVDFGKAGGHGGYHHELDEGIKKRAKYAESITLSHEEQHHLTEARLEAHKLGQQEVQEDAKVKSLKERLNQARINGTKEQASALETEVKSAETQLSQTKDLRAQANAAAAALSAKEQGLRLRYAENMDNIKIGRFGLYTAGTRMREGAATNIRNTIAQSPQQRLAKQFEKLMNQQQSGGDQAHAAPAPATAPAAPAGGGGGGGGAHTH